MAFHGIRREQGRTGNSGRRRVRRAYYKSLAYDEEGAFLNSRYAADNAIVFVEATEYERPGDWWYLKNKKWIDAWAGVLNSDVRGGKMSLTDFYKSAEFIGTQEILYDYTRR